MSIHRVLETARRLGLPVIFTDDAGREPMVVVPLEQFEAMVGSAPVSHGSSSVVSSGVDPEYEAVAASLAKDFEATLASRSTLMGSVAGHQSGQVKGVADKDLALEERFYIEPVEDESTGVVSTGYTGSQL